MRSPRGHGAGRRSALALSSLVMLSAVIAVPTLGSDHLASERATAPKPAKILVVSPDDHVMLVGDSRVLNIEICREDGSGCKPANKSKATVKPGNGLKLSGKKGAQIRVTGKRPGLYELTFRQGKATGETTVKINEPPSREPAGPTGDDYRVYISPGELILEEGQHAAFMLWGCLPGDNGGLGLNRLPDGVDDECIELEILDLDFDEDAVSVLGPQGSRFVVTMELFPEDSTEEQAFVGVQAVTEYGSTLASIIKKRAERLSEFIESGEPLGDTNGNGVWDSEDWERLWVAMFTDRYDPRFDVDEDGSLDAVDWDALTQGAPGMPTPPPARTEDGSSPEG